MSQRNRNPYLLTAEEKLAVVDLYARFATTAQVIDEVIKWKPEAATGDDPKDRKNATDAIRTCNPHSSVFSFQVALQARRAEYLAEQSGGFATAILSMVSTLTTQLPNMQFDLSTVDLTDLPKIVNALKGLHALMEEMGITNRAEISKAVNFGRRLDEYPEDNFEGVHNQTRRQLAVETENYEVIISEQIDNGTNRNCDEIDDGRYPDNYEFPDYMIKEAWRTLFSDDTDQKPSISQMRKEIEEKTAPDGKMPGDDEGYWWDETMSPEDKLELLRGFLSNDCLSYTPSGKAEHIAEQEQELRDRRLFMKADQLGINVVKDKIFSRSQLQDKVEELTGIPTVY